MQPKAVSINKLERIKEFEAVLQSYVPSRQSIEILQSTPTVLLVGPTAAGRNTLIRILEQTGRYYYVISDTTRKPRLNDGIMETDGNPYWFKSEDYFLNGLRNGKYIEAAIIHRQQVSGVSISELEKACQQGLIAINEVQPDGARTYNKYHKDALIIFLLPPSFDVWMERLHGRGEIEESEIRRRLQSAIEEIEEALRQDFYHFVINNDIHEAAMAVDELANGRLPKPEKQQHGRDHAEQLALDVQLYLAQEA